MLCVWYTNQLPQDSKDSRENRSCTSFACSTNASHLAPLFQSLNHQAYVESCLGQRMRERKELFCTNRMFRFCCWRSIVDQEPSNQAALSRLIPSPVRKRETTNKQISYGAPGAKCNQCCLQWVDRTTHLMFEGILQFACLIEGFCVPPEPGLSESEKAHY